MLKRLLSSRKAFLLLIAIIGVIVLTAIGKVDADKAWTFLTVSFPAWIVGQSIEDAAGKKAEVNDAGSE